MKIFYFNGYPNALKASLVITYMGLVTLIFSFIVWQFTRPTGPSFFFLVMQLVPLFIVIPAVVRQRPRAYIWLCFIMLMYFVKGVDGMVSPSKAWIDYVVLTTSIILFISSMMSSRWLQSYFNSLHQEHDRNSPATNNLQSS